MERWTFGKLEFLAWWAIPMIWLAAPVAAIALVLNWLTGGVFAHLLGIIAIVLITIAGTVSALWILLWVDVE